MSENHEQPSVLDCARSVMNRAAAGESVIAEQAEAVARGLREERRFAPLTEFAAALREAGVDTPLIRTLDAQAMLDLGRIDSAIGTLSTARLSIGADDPLNAEFDGLLGRAFKEQFLRLPDKHGDEARRVLAKAADQYRAAASINPNWAVPNLMALNRAAERHLGERMLGSEPEDLGRELLVRLDAAPQAERDLWYHATRAELRLGFGDIAGAADEIAQYVRDPRTTSFQIAGTLRQYVQLWDLPAMGATAGGIVEALQASQFRKDFGSLSFDETVAQVTGKADA
jgi:hypothetical protein